MAIPFETKASAKSRLDDYFTATVVGLPEEISLGKAFSNRILRDDQFVSIDAITAKAWLSDPARALLTQRLKQAQPTLHKVGLPFPAGSFVRSRRWGRSTILAFLLGFCACMALFALYLALPWLQQFVHF